MVAPGLVSLREERLKSKLGVDPVAGCSRANAPNGRSSKRLKSPATSTVPSGVTMMDEIGAEGPVPTLNDGSSAPASVKRWR